MDTYPCDCSDEYGPCEAHGETVVSREGASLRTADELCQLFVTDAQALGAELSPYGLDVMARVGAALNGAGPDRGNWLEDPDLVDELMTVHGQAETELDTLGFMVYHDDGYRIIRPSVDCPLLADA